jgi:predicted GNAT family acetyltransferase
LILSHCSQDSLSFLAHALRKQGQPLPALHGLRSLVELFLESWPELSSREQRREVQGLYRLDQVIEPPRTGARFDQASLDDLPLLAAWHRAFWQETGDFALSDQVLHDMLRSRIEGRDLFLLRDDRGPLSMASLTRKVKNGRVLSYIYTPAEYRGRGYAAELTAALSRFCLENDKRFCCLFTQMENPTSNKIYQQVGYRWIDDFMMIRFET